MYRDCWIAEIHEPLNRCSSLHIIIIYTWCIRTAPITCTGVEPALPPRGHVTPQSTPPQAGIVVLRQCGLPSHPMIMGDAINMPCILPLRPAWLGVKTCCSATPEKGITASTACTSGQSINMDGLFDK